MADYEQSILTVDVVCFTLINWQLHVLLAQRTSDPFEGKLALPGGIVHSDPRYPPVDANTEVAARRVAREKLNLEVNYLEQLEVFSGPDRDPRGWSASIAYMAMLQSSLVNGGHHREFYPISHAKLHGLPELGFDHNEIISVALARLRSKTTYSSLPLFLMPATFSFGDLQEVYETILQMKLTRTNFRRRIIAQGIVEPTGRFEIGTEHRPGELYRRGVRKLRTFDQDVLR